jgi:hypothetical protein
LIVPLQLILIGLHTHSGLLLAFPTLILCAFLFPPCVSRMVFSLLLSQNMNHTVVLFSPAPCYFLLLRSKTHVGSRSQAFAIEVLALCCLIFCCVSHSHLARGLGHKKFERSTDRPCPLFLFRSIACIVGYFFRQFQLDWFWTNVTFTVRQPHCPILRYKIHASESSSKLRSKLNNFKPKCQLNKPSSQSPCLLTIVSANFMNKYLTALTLCNKQEMYLVLRSWGSSVSVVPD